MGGGCILAGRWANRVSQAVNDWGLFSVSSSDAAGRVEDPHLRRRAFEAQRPGRMISVNRSANGLQGLHLLCNASPECDYVARKAMVALAVSVVIFDSVNALPWFKAGQALNFRLFGV